MIKYALISLIFSFLISPAFDPAEELDAYWKEVSRTIAEGDFEGYAASYHKDAILVNGTSGNSYPISQALAGWKQGFDDTKAGKMKASVEFRFSERFLSETTAHETGIFKYTSEDESGKPQSIYVHFQGLLTKAGGEWKLMMEYQISMATEEEWEAIKK